VNKSFRIIFTKSILKLQAVVSYLEIGHILRFLSRAVKCHCLVLQHFLGNGDNVQHKLSVNLLNWLVLPSLFYYICGT